MERLTKRNSEGAVILAKGCHDGCEYLTCHIEEGYQCNHQCEADCMCKLAKYEDAEENGMLKHLPCRVGDTVYLIDHSICRNRKKPLECIIDEFTVDHNNECYAVLNGGERIYALRRFRAVNIKEFGKTVFLTREAAEQALKQMGE